MRSSIVHGFWLIALAMVGTVAATAAQAQTARPGDVPGSKDPPSLKRFEGSKIAGYFTRSFDEYTLALGEAKDAGFEKSEKLEGAITRIIYRVPVGHTELELFRNYEHALSEAGYSLLYERKPWERDGAFMLNFHNQVKIKGSSANPFYLGGGSSASGAYLAARATKDGQDFTLAVVVHEHSNGDYVWAVADVKDGVPLKTGEIIVGIDVIVSKAVEIKMIEIKSDAMAKALAETGKIDIYGILFDTDKTDIKPASTPTLEQVAKLLKDDPALKLEVAGHTDSTGDKDHNAKLSDGRAVAVVQSLIKTYGIDAARLQAKGYGDTKPVAPNDTEDGRAKNRRVELRKI